MTDPSLPEERSPVSTDTTPRRTALLLALGALVVALGAVVFLRGGSADPVVVLDIPAEDHVVPEALGDGTPVWISSTADGPAARVLEALTGGPGPIAGMVGWCEAGNRYVEPHMGLTFAPDGRRYAGFVPGRIDPRQDQPVGLTPRRIQGAGDAEAGDPVRVFEALGPPPEVLAAPLGGEQGHGPPGGCRLAERRLDGTAGPIADPPQQALTGLVGHGFLARPLQTGANGWQVAGGYLRISPDGTTSWCHGDIDSARTGACQPGDAPDVAVQVTAEQAGTVVTVIGDPLAVRVEDGQIVQVATVPSSTWKGSSLQGTFAHRVMLLLRDPTGSRVLLSDGEGACITAAPPQSVAPPGTNVIYVDADTVVDIGDITDVQALDLLQPERGGTEVDVVIDAITCRALAIRAVS